MVGLETVMGTDEQIDFSDILNGTQTLESIVSQELLVTNFLIIMRLVDPQERPELSNFKVHDAMEVKLSIF